MFSVSALRMPAVLIPTSRPERSTSGPPELPGLIAASVCSSPVRSPFGPSIVRSSPETIPEVTVGPPRPRREADRDHDVAEPERRRAGQRDRDEVARLDAHHREVALRRRPDHRPLQRLRVHVVVEGDRDPRRALDDVVVRQDQPVTLEDHARRLALAAAERRRLDVDDRREDARRPPRRASRPGRAPAAVSVGRRLADRDRLRRGRRRRRLVVAAVAAGEQRRRGERRRASLTAASGT